MQAPPESRTAPGASRGGGKEIAVQNSKTRIPTSTRRSNQEIVATIEKSHSCQLRISLSTWRGRSKLEIADFTSVIPGIYFQTGAGVTLDIEKLPELLKPSSPPSESASSGGGYE